MHFSVCMYMHTGYCHCYWCDVSMFLCVYTFTLAVLRFFVVVCNDFLFVVFLISWLLHHIFPIFHGGFPMKIYNE